MSDRDAARRVHAEIAFAGADITESIRKHLISVTYTDNEEDGTDDLQIRVADRDGVWVAEWLGDAISAAASNSGFCIQAAFVRKNWNSDGKDSVLDCGRFGLDAVTADGPPSVISVKGTSIPYGTGIRQALKCKAWESCSLSGIAAQVAAGGGMACLYESGNDPYYERVEQVRVSDIGFLSRLCHDAGISLKATDNIVVLFDQASYEAKPAVLDIKRGGKSYVKWRLMSGSAGTKYTSCRVSYTDPGTGSVIEATAYAGEGDTGHPQQLEVTAKAGSIAEAMSLAEMHLRLHNKHGLTAKFTMPGNPMLLAGNTVTLTGWGAWSGKHIISQAQHSLGDSGYTTQIALRKALEG